MGLLDRFGKGGASVSLEIGAEAKAGEALAGHVIVTGGKRVQRIDGVKVWLAKTKSFTLNGGERAENSMMGQPVPVPATFEVQPGEQQRVAFSLPIPKAAPSSRQQVNGQPVLLTEYAVFASADIKGQIDPQGSAAVEVVGGLEAKISIGA